jgi:hypothetical protein
MHNRQAIDLGRIWKAAKDFDLWPMYLVGFFADIPQSPPNTYLVIILRNLGFNTVCSSSSSRHNYSTDPLVLTFLFISS